MNNNANRTQPLSNTQEELSYQAVLNRKIETRKEKVSGRQSAQNPYNAEEIDRSSYHLQPKNTENHHSQDEVRPSKDNQQVYLNGVPMNAGTQPQRPENYNLSPNTLGQPQHQNPNQNPIIIRNNDQLIISGAPQTVVIINQNPKQTVKQEDSWERQSRVGCCCISMHNTTCCCDYYCVNSCCQAIQGNNLCCYCHSMDCVQCCVNHACRACCLQKQFCECMLECCKHMPLCLLIGCLKDGKCCQCLGECCKNISCECLKNCDSECMRNGCEVLCRGIGEVICCFFK